METDKININDLEKCFLEIANTYIGTRRGEIKMISIEPSSGTVITGASDDLIEIEGELSEEFNSYGCSNGRMACSDGTLLKVDYAEDGIWRFRPIVKGNLFDKVVYGSVEKDTNDKAYFKPGLKWCTFSDEMQVKVKGNK